MFRAAGSPRHSTLNGRLTHPVCPESPRGPGSHAALGHTRLSLQARASGPDRENRQVLGFPQGHQCFRYK